MSKIGDAYMLQSRPPLFDSDLEKGLHGHVFLTGLGKRLNGEVRGVDT
jgi:hypothetical protein